MRKRRRRRRWRNPRSPSIFHGYSAVAALGHASFNLARSTRTVKTPNPRRPIAFPCRRRLLYVCAKSFRISLPPPLFLSHPRASASQLPFQVTPPRALHSVPALENRGRRSWIFAAGAPARRNCRAATVTKSRAAANITRRNPRRSFVRAAFHFVRREIRRL